MTLQSKMNFISALAWTGCFLLVAEATGLAPLVSQARAADLGAAGCCADLEERIAELEYTAARKGNRKISLEVSGQVNQALMYWDDGVESNVYSVTNDSSRTRFRFKGDAKINADWKAGYLLEIGVRGANSKRTTQEDDNGEGANATDLRHSVWFVESKSLGRVWVGLTGGAGEGVTETSLTATKDVQKYSDVEDTGLGLFTRVNGVRSGLQWRRLLRDGGDQPGEGRRYNMVRYDTPELAGFRATVNWGEDDAWEVGGQYKGEFGDFKLAAAFAYGEDSDATGGQSGLQCVGNTAAYDRHCSQIGGSASLMHKPTGLYLNLAGGLMRDRLIRQDTGLSFNPALADPRHSFYAAEVGLEQKWLPLGPTTLFVQGMQADGGTLDRSFMAGGDIVSSELRAYGFGVVQSVDAAAMNLYLTYRHYTGEITQLPGGVEQTTSLDGLDVVMGGAILRF